MLRNLNASRSGRRVLGTWRVGILASQIAAETADGDYGTGLLYDEAIDPANAGKYLRVRITSRPASGTLVVKENGSFTLTGAVVGSYTFGYAVDANAVQIKTDTATINVGGGATAPGASLTGGATLTPGSASGQQAGTAPGATLEGAATLSAGAPGGGAGVAGATLTGGATITAGSASGTSAGDGSAPGVTLTGGASLSPGAPVAQQNPIAPGVSLTGTSSLSAGAAGDTTLLADDIDPDYTVSRRRTFDVWQTRTFRVAPKRRFTVSKGSSHARH